MYKQKMGIIVALLVLSLSGCGAPERQVVPGMQTPYEKITYQTTEVMRGDLGADLTLRLMAEGYKETVYCAPGEAFQLDEVHVAAGEYVKKGELLVSFESEEIEEKIAQYQDDISRKELMIVHYENLMKADKEADYETDIQMLREDIQVAQLYIEEAKELLSDYQIVAEADGVITEISEFLQNRVITKDVELITQVSGTGRYLASSNDTDLFVIGDCYQVDVGGVKYEVVLTGKENSTLFFEPSGDEKSILAQERLMLSMEMSEQKDVIYVNKNAVHTIKGEKQDTYCVYTMQPNGYQRAVFVTPGNRLGENIIILQGLKGGERVVIR